MGIEQSNILRTIMPSQKCAAVQADGNEAETRREKILLVGGAAVKNAVVAALGEAKYEVLEARTTSEALGMIPARGVDLVVVELTAPEKGGVEFCHVLKKATGTQFLPVFVFSDRDEPEAEISAIEAGAEAFITAPLRPRTFRARVQASLRHKAMIESLDDSERVLFSLAESVEQRDPDLGEHCQRLATMAAIMGMALGLPSTDILSLQRGGYLHDVGKVAIPDSVLFKPGKLTPDEWETMKTHAERGERICFGVRSLAPVLPIIRHHHEKWDGSGYPDRLSGESIPLLARILQLADIYDALTTARPYKRAMAPEEALQIIRSEAAQGWRDPHLVEMFGDVLPMFHKPATPDFTPVSLQALAASLENFRNRNGVNGPFSMPAHLSNTVPLLSKAS